MRYINPKAIPAPNMPGWYSLPDFPHYAISEDGRVWSYYKKKLLKPIDDIYGYLYVNFYNIVNGASKRTVCKIHRLVGWIFVKLPEEFNRNYDIATINHKDHNKKNNHYANLEWTTQSYNSREAWTSGCLDHKKRSCFIIDIKNKTRKDFDSAADAGKYYMLRESTLCYTILKEKVLYGQYIAGYLDDPVWIERFKKLTIDEIIDLYADKINNYKRTGPKPCFVIDINNKTLVDFSTNREIDDYLNLPKDTATKAMYQSNGVIQGKYIVGYVEDFDWSYLLQDQGIDAFIQLYSDTIANYTPNKKKCFYIDSLYNTYHEFGSARDIDRDLNLPIDTVSHAIRKNNGLIQGRYIAGYLNDPEWKEAFANSTIAQIVESYADQIENYKPRNRGPRKITNLKTGESKEYKSLSEFAKEHGLDPDHIGRYLETHSDLYSVELA